MQHKRTKSKTTDMNQPETSQKREDISWGQVGRRKMGTDVNMVCDMSSYC